MLPLDGLEQKLPQNKVFGKFFSGILLLISIYFYAKNYYYICIFLISLSFTLALITFFVPDLLSKFNIYWFKLGILIGRIFNPIFMGIIYYLLFTPYALLGKILGRDILLIKKSRLKSYWALTEKDAQKSQNFKKQF